MMKKIAEGDVKLDGLERREVLRLILAGGPLMVATTRFAAAQSTKRSATIGFLGVDSIAWKSWASAFSERMAQLNWVDGKTARFEYRWSEGRPERIAEIAAEFVRLKVDIVVTSGSPVPTLMKVAPNIPVVFAIANDPVGAGIVRSLSRPGGKVTGMSLLAPDLAGKRLQLLREVVPKLQRLAIMADATFPSSVREMQEVESIATRLKMDVRRIEIRSQAEIRESLRGFGGRVDALYVVINDFLNGSRSLITTLAMEERLPAIFGTRDWAASGGLMSYGPIFPDLFRRAAELTDLILRGRNPGDIPVEQPTRFELVLNASAARLLKIRFPQTIQSVADALID